MARTFRSPEIVWLLGPLKWGFLVIACAVVGDWHWETRRLATDQANIVRLNSMVAEYRQRTGHAPDLNMIELFRAGLSDTRLHPTPYGGTYLIDPAEMMVYNPHRPGR